MYYYLEFKLRFLKNMRLFSIRVKELSEPSVLQINKTKQKQKQKHKNKSKNKKQKTKSKAKQNNNNNNSKTKTVLFFLKHFLKILVKWVYGENPSKFGRGIYMGGTQLFFFFFFFFLQVCATRISELGGL